MVGLVTASTERLTIEYKLEIILKLRPYGQAVKTPPFHGGIPSSNLGRVTNLSTPAHGGDASIKARNTAGRSPRTYKNSFCFMEV